MDHRDNFATSKCMLDVVVSQKACLRKNKYMYVKVEFVYKVAMYKKSEILNADVENEIETSY